MNYIFSSVAGDSLTLSSTAAILACALLTGFFISCIYIFTHKESGYVPSFAITLIMLPAIIATIILLVGSNVARAFSLAGAFSLVRFRSAPGDPKDIAYVFFTVAVGLASGMGFLTYSLLFAFVLCLAMVILEKSHFGIPKSEAMTLKIAIPEDLNYEGLFDKILKEYTDSWKIRRIRTTEFGTLFELVYRIQMKQNISQKAFLDSIRCRNGNMNVTLVLNEYEDRIYE
ncbi:DUF4956 domain-containing protein [Qiania dongpingensis]|uniref:DUF4956 domain-containing protein n=1 Tax=Qiania dongpingensis TaxID=2763669 RepID=A0A7G9G434_9FIRM|nr:DUF4956 domain-containing protein [Qiania dongpingensis]QNM05566.1 DUF4956 domain-containing protein [Qiania dongpingensis]